MTNPDLTPVSEWENRGVNGDAQAHPEVFANHVAEVKRLRAKEEAWWASLPVDSGDALRAIKETLHPDGEDYPAGFETVLHLSKLIALAMEAYEADEYSPSHTAMRWAVDLVASSAQETAAELRKMTDMAVRPLSEGRG